MLTERQLKILRYIVELHVATAEPVGSRHLVKRYNLELSPATIRNTMSDLEDMGYLTQPHTSAGRIPTDEGYRVYVANLENSAPFAQDQKLLRDLEDEYLSKCSEIRGVLANAVKILSEISHLTGIAISPTSNERPIRKVQLVGIDSQRIQMVVVNASGLVSNHMLEVGFSAPQSVLNRLSDIINDNFSQAALSKLLTEELLVLREIESRYRKSVRSLMGTLSEQLVQAATNERLYLEGVSHILEQPEFRNFESARLVFERFGKDAKLTQLLHGEMGDGTQVAIGLEDKLEGLQDFALITSRYKGNNCQGAIGILGPRRMEYARVMALVSYMSRRISELLSKELG